MSSTVELSSEVGRARALQSADWLDERVYTSAGAREGPRAFAEMRAPVRPAGDWSIHRHEE